MKVNEVLCPKIGRHLGTTLSVTSFASNRYYRICPLLSIHSYMYERSSDIYIYIFNYNAGQEEVVWVPYQIFLFLSSNSFHWDSRHETRWKVFLSKFSHLSYQEKWTAVAMTITMEIHRSEVESKCQFTVLPLCVSGAEILSCLEQIYYL